MTAATDNIVDITNHGVKKGTQSVKDLINENVNDKTHRTDMSTKSKVNKDIRSETAKILEM